MKPKLTPAHRLALIACLPAAAGAATASAGTVTLLSQERSVFAAFDGVQAAQGTLAPVSDINLSERLEASDFGVFNESAEVDVQIDDFPIDPPFGPFASRGRAQQRSSFEQVGSDVLLNFEGSAKRPGLPRWRRCFCGFCLRGRLQA